MGARRVLVLGPIALVAALALAPGTADGATPGQISIQPVTVAPGKGTPGRDAARLRKIVVRAVRARGLRVTTQVPRAEGTGQYYTWARELGLKAFVSSELEVIGRRRRATFLVWSGNTGGVVGRWTVTARAADLPRTVARGFWPHLGRSFRRTQVPPEWRQLGPGPTQRIDAGFAQDENIGGHHPGKRRASLILR